MWSCLMMNLVVVLRTTDEKRERFPIRRNWKEKNKIHTCPEKFFPYLLTIADIIIWFTLTLCFLFYIFWIFFDFYIVMPSAKPSQISPFWNIGKASKWNEPSHESGVCSNFSWGESWPFRRKTKPCFRKHRKGKETPSKWAYAVEERIQVFYF